MKDKSYILQLIKQSVNTTEPNAILILYGSYARGDFKDDSDLDMLVLIDKDKITRSDQKRIKYPLYDIEFDTGTIISPLIFSKKDWEMRHRNTPFYENVAREGKVLWAQTHSGVRQMFGLHFVKSGLIIKESGKFYTVIFDLRQTGDYDDYIDFKKEDVLDFMGPANELISKIENLLSK